MVSGSWVRLELVHKVGSGVTSCGGGGDFQTPGKY